MISIKWIISDVSTITKRNLLKYIRLPQLIIFSTVQPVMFLLLFAYVFGGAINVPGIDYINFLIPAIIVQTVLFGSIQTGLGLTEDLSSGLIDRFKSLPMARSAVLAGRTLADATRNLFVICLMVGIGFLMGFSFQDGIFRGILAMFLALCFGFAFSWISATIGLAVKNPETAQVAGFIWVFPLVFASSAFVPIETMPSALEWFAKINPITVTIDAVRALTLGLPIGDNLWQSAFWILGILIFFTFLSVRLYRKV